MVKKTATYEIEPYADTWISEDDKTWNMGKADYLWAQVKTGGTELRSMLAFLLPAAGEKFDDHYSNRGSPVEREMPEGFIITSMTLWIFIEASGVNPSPLTQYLQFKEIIDEFKEGLGDDPPGYVIGTGANWNTKNGEEGWTFDLGDDSGTEGGAWGVFCNLNTILQDSNENDYLGLGITASYLKYRGIQIGQILKLGLKLVDGTPASDNFVKMCSRHIASATKRPYLRITGEYWDDETEIPDQEDAFLSFEPNPANPTQPKLMWKRPKNQGSKKKDGSNEGAFVLIRDTSPIVDYGDGTIVARITSDLEYIDTASLTDGQVYYYRLLICNEENYIKGTGVGSWTSGDVEGIPAWSNEVVIEKPKVNSFVESGADYTWDVWEEHTVQVTCQTPTLNNVQNDAYQYDWQGDGSEVGWKELETPSNTDSQAYRYTAYGGGSVTPKVRVRNSLGFWSAQYSLGSAITLTALNAIAEIRASPKELKPGQAFRVRADESQDQNADGTITKYQFRVHRLDTNQDWNHSTQTWVAPTVWNDLLLVSVMDIPANKIDHSTATTYQCWSKARGLSGVDDTSDQLDVAGVVETTVDIRSGLSTACKLEMLGLDRSTVQTVITQLEGTGDTVIHEGVSGQRRTLIGVSRKSEVIDDILQLNTWIEDQTYLKLQYSISGTAKYIYFRIKNLRGRRRDERRIEWQVQMNIEDIDT